MILKPSNAVDDLKNILNKKYLYAGAWEELFSIEQKEYMSFRKELKNDLYNSQNECCAYCECQSAKSALQIEHFAPKGGKKKPMYVDQQFNPLNLVLSCRECNNTKDTYDPVLTQQKDYNQWTFKILHPYFDDPKDYFSLVPLVDGTKGFFPIIRKDVDFNHKEKAEETFMVFKFYEEKTITRIVKSFLGTLYYSDVKDTVLDTAKEIREQLESRREIAQKRLIHDALVYKKSF